MKKYKLVGEFEFYGKKFFQIKALISFGNVLVGELGGYIEKEENLNQYDNAWVSGNAMVYDNAWVSGNAMVYDNARVSGNAWVSGNARVCGNAVVSGDARVFGDARVSGDAWVSGNAMVSGNAVVSGNAWVFGDARVYRDADVMWISKIGSRFATLTIFKTKDGFKLATGCFLGTFEEFKNAVASKKEDDKHRKEYESLYGFIELRFGNKQNDKVI